LTVFSLGAITSEPSASATVSTVADIDDDDDVEKVDRPQLPSLEYTYDNEGELVRFDEEDEAELQDAVEEAVVDALDLKDEDNTSGKKVH
jgi:hypothetical protein